MFFNMNKDDKKLNKNITLEKLYKIKTNHGELKGVSYSSGGSMLGERYEISIKYADGSLIGRKRVSGAHWIPIRVYEYEVEESALNHLKEYIDKYNLTVWDRLPYDDEMVVLDGPSHNIRLSYDDSAVGGSKYESFDISYENVIPENGREVLDDFVKLISNEFKEDKLIGTYLELDDKKVFTGKTIENSDEEIYQLLNGYWVAQKEVTADKLTGSQEERIFDDKEYYYFDVENVINKIEEIEIKNVGLNEENKIYKAGEIVHETFEDYDCSWYLPIYNEDDVPTTYYLILVGDKLYVEKSYTYTDHSLKDVIVFVRRDLN